MAYDADPAATHNPATGTDAPASWGDIVNENFRVLGAAWTSFTPTWTGTTTNPVIGTGTLSGAYVQVGKTLHVRYRILMGGTTTFGSGSWKLRLPNSLSAVAGTTQIAPVWAIDTGAAYYTGAALIGTEPLNDFDDFVMVSSGGTGLWSPTVPHTWASGDALVVEGTIELA